MATNVPIEEIERRLRWRLLPALLFVSVLATLTTFGVLMVLVPPQRPHGLPDDADARRVAAVLAGRVAIPTHGLRFRSTVLGGEPEDHATGAPMLSLVASARPALELVHRRHPNDSRALAALAALDLADHDYEGALRRFRGSCERAPHYGEGRLGAGVALALQADRTPEAPQSRAMRLEAIAEFAAVDSVDVEYPLALFDRAIVLADAGYRREAAFWAARFRAREPNSPWSTRLPW
jgi:hypothetical protein